MCRNLRRNEFFHSKKKPFFSLGYGSPPPNFLILCLHLTSIFLPGPWSTSLGNNKLKIQKKKYICFFKVLRKSLVN